MNLGTTQLIAIAIAFSLALAFSYNDTGRADCERHGHSPATCFEAMNR